VASDCRLILLPGLGADARLLDPQRAVFPRLEVPPWLPHEPGETLPHYAQRMAATVAPSEHFYLGGVSFGGMVALEMAVQLRPQAVFLVASCRTGRAIAPHLRYFGRFASILPERTFAAAAALSPLFLSKFGRLTAAQEALFKEMLADVEPDFVRWGIDAITSWEGNPALDMPVYQIHGGDDQLIPAKSVPADRVVPGGGHLLNVTHREEVNTFIAERLGGYGPVVAA